MSVLGSRYSVHFFFCPLLREILAIRTVLIGKAAGDGKIAEQARHGDAHRILRAKVINCCSILVFIQFEKTNTRPIVVKSAFLLPSVLLNSIHFISPVTSVARHRHRLTNIKPLPDDNKLRHDKDLPYEDAILLAKTTLNLLLNPSCF